MAGSVTEWIVETAKQAHAGHGADAGGLIVREAIAQKKFSPDRLNLRELAEACLGRHTFEHTLRTFGARAGWVSEAIEGVDLSTFRSVVAANVGAVQERAYQDSKSVVDQLLGTAPDDAGTDPMQTRKDPVEGVATDPPRDVAPGTDYPRTGFSPFYTEAPIPDKVGLIACLTMEMVKANQVQRFIRGNEEVARKVGVEERKRKLRVVVGVTNNYRRNGTGYNTYLTAGDRVNRLTDFIVGNGPDELDRLAQVFEAMTNPFTGEPMDVDPKAILSTRGNQLRLREIIGTRTVRITSGSQEFEAPVENPFDFAGEVLTDRYVYNLLVNERGLTAAVAKTWVMIGDPQRAFKWREVEPFRTYEVGPNDPAWPPAFFQDVVYATKSSFWGVAYVADPFAVAEGYNSAAT